MAIRCAMSNASSRRILLRHDAGHEPDACGLVGVDVAAGHMISNARDDPIARGSR